MTVEQRGPSWSQRSFAAGDDVACEKILGFRVTTERLDTCLNIMTKWLEASREARYIACINPHSTEVAQRDALFAEALRAADLPVPDGIGIVVASRILGGTIRQRITGSDIFWGLNAVLNERGGTSAFFLGSTKENLDSIRVRMRQEYPHVEVVGLYSPPFSDSFTDIQSQAMVDAVNAVQPDVLWIGMTAPKQEKWVWQYRSRLQTRLIGPVGAVFDFFTGRIRRSSPTAQRMGLEWLPRLMQEPRRLWRRNLVSSPRFIVKVLAERIKK